MRRSKLFAVFPVLLALCLWTPPAQGSSMTLTFSFDVHPRLGYEYGGIYDVYGRAYYPYEEFNATNVSIFTHSGNWLRDMSSGYLNDPQSVILVGAVPTPQAPGPGYIQQDVTIKWWIHVLYQGAVTYTPHPGSHDYRDVGEYEYRIGAAVDQTADAPFSSLVRSAYVYVNGDRMERILTQDLTNPETSTIEFSGFHRPIIASLDNYYEFLFTDAIGDCYQEWWYGDVKITVALSQIATTAAVPIPPTVLLLGSGLIPLAWWRRRNRLGK